MRVCIKWILIICRRCLCCPWTFNYGPSVILAGEQFIDLLIKTPSYVIDKDLFSTRLNRSTKRVSESERIDHAVVTAECAVVWVIGWNCPIFIDTENLS